MNLTSDANSAATNAASSFLRGVEMKKPLALPRGGAVDHAGIGDDLARALINRDW
jgi:hypothetical protein